MRHDVLVCKREDVVAGGKEVVLVSVKDNGAGRCIYAWKYMLDAYIFPRLLEEFAKSLKGTGDTAEASRLMAVGCGPNINCDKTSVTCATSNDNEKERQVKNSDS